MNHLRDVYSAVYPASTKWYAIGLQLQVSVEALESIKQKQEHHGAHDHLMSVLKFWLYQGGATWRALSDALKSTTVREYHLASVVDNRIRRLMIQLQPESTSILSKMGEYSYLMVLPIFTVIPQIADYLNHHLISTPVVNNTWLTMQFYAQVHVYSQLCSI